MSARRPLETASHILQPFMSGEGNSAPRIRFPDTSVPGLVDTVPVTGLYRCFERVVCVCCSKGRDMDPVLGSALKEDTPLAGRGPL